MNLVQSSTASPLSLALVDKYESKAFSQDINDQRNKVMAFLWTLLYPSSVSLGFLSATSCLLVGMAAGSSSKALIVHGAGRNQILKRGLVIHNLCDLGFRPKVHGALPRLLITELIVLLDSPADVLPCPVWAR